MQKKLLNCGYISLDCGKCNFTKNNDIIVNFDKGDIIHLKRIENKEIYIYPDKPYIEFIIFHSIKIITYLTKF